VVSHLPLHCSRSSGSLRRTSSFKTITQCAISALYVVRNLLGTEIREGGTGELTPPSVSRTGFLVQPSGSLPKTSSFRETCISTIATTSSSRARMPCTSQGRNTACGVGTALPHTDSSPPHLSTRSVQSQVYARYRAYGQLTDYRLALEMRSGVRVSIRAGQLTDYDPA
jgi:hypothetical protein